MTDDRVKQGTKDYWNRWDWEWFLSLELGKRKPAPVLKDFIITLQKLDGIQIATVGVLSHSPQDHIHLLALGQSRKGLSLKDSNPVPWERYWAETVHKSAKIIRIPSFGDQRRIVSYMVDRNMPRGYHETLQEYNLKLLKRSRAR